MINVLLCKIMPWEFTHFFRRFFWTEKQNRQTQTHGDDDDDDDDGGAPVMMTTIVTTSITFDWWPRARSSRIQEEFITQSEVKTWIIIIYLVFKWKLSHSQKHFWHTWYVWRISDFFAWQISNSPKCGEIWNLPCIVAIYDILLPNLLFHDLHAFAWRKI